MHGIPALEELAVVVGIGVLVVLILSRLKLPTVTGLIVAGALMGPAGFGVVQDKGLIDTLAEVGVVLLLFTIGLEFSLDRLKRIGRLVAIGGGLQVGLTLAAILAVAVALGEPVPKALFLGMVIALSSTAIVLRILADRGELDAPHGRFVVGALIFQDLCVVPMVLLVPILAGQTEGNATLAIAQALAKAVAVVFATVVVARVVVPRLFAMVDASRSRELFLMTVVTICIGTAWLTSLAGLSLALGAFLAGLVLADTEYQHRAMGDILPLRDILTSLFFMSLGMMFDGRVLFQNPAHVVLLLAALLLGKGLVATLSALVMKFPARVAWMAGASLAQFGEFGFILLLAGQKAGLATPAEVDTLLAAGVITMTITPLIVRAAPHFGAGEAILRPLERLLGARGIDEPESEDEKLSGHVVLAGYGVAGRVVVDALRDSGVPYIVLELNAETVREAREAGEPVYYADVTSPETLRHGRLEHAAAMVLLINDPASVKRAVAAAHQCSPTTPVIARNRFLGQRKTLLQAGATEVVVDEVEAGIETLARVLRRAGMPRNVMAERLTAARAATQESERERQARRQLGVAMPELSLLQFERFLVRQGTHALGKSIREMSLRGLTGATLVALRRDGKLVDHVSPDEPLQEDDLVFLVGSDTALCRAGVLLETGQPPETCDTSTAE